MVQSSTHFLMKTSVSPLVQPVSNNRGDDMFLTSEETLNLHTRHRRIQCPDLSGCRRISDLSLRRPLTNWLCNAELYKVETRLEGRHSQIVYSSCRLPTPYFSRIKHFSSLIVKMIDIMSTLFLWLAEVQLLMLCHCSPAHFICVICSVAYILMRIRQQMASYSQFNYRHKHHIQTFWQVHGEGGIKAANCYTDWLRIFSQCRCMALSLYVPVSISACFCVINNAHFVQHSLQFSIISQLFIFCCIALCTKSVHIHECVVVLSVCFRQVSLWVWVLEHWQKLPRRPSDTTMQQVTHPHLPFLKTAELNM